MPDPLAVTSCSTEGWFRYAKEGVETLLEHWPGPVLVYYEHDQPTLRHERLHYRNLYQDKDAFYALESFRRIPFLMGRMPDGSYNYNYDACKFSRKVFALCDPAREDHDLVAWVDADVRLTAPVTREFLEGLLGDSYTAYLGRQDYHSECGFVLYDGRQPIHSEFKARWRHMYLNGSAIALPGGVHDCWSYDYMRAALKVPGVNLSPDASKDKLDAWELSPLKDVGFHLKGRRKYAA